MTKVVLSCDMLVFHCIPCFVPFHSILSLVAIWVDCQLVGGGFDLHFLSCCATTKWTLKVEKDRFARIFMGITKSR